jgi:V8-like Glu-specific endopeptidase
VTQETDNPSAAETPAVANESLQKDRLQGDIDALFPLLRKTDTSTQLAHLLNIVARGKTMGKLGYDMLRTFADRLKQTRAFDDLYVLTSEMNSEGLQTQKTRRLEVQALVEMGVFETALDLVRPLLVGEIETFDVQEAYGLLGRIYKQMFVAAWSPENPAARAEAETLRLYLERSFNAYMEVWNKVKAPATTYQAINAVAVAQMAVRAQLVDGESDAEREGIKELANEIINVIASAKKPDVWAEATRGEALVALAMHSSEPAPLLDAAARAYAAFAEHPDVDAFSLGASLRQLREIWGIDGGDAVHGKPVRILKAAILAKLETAAEKNKADAKAPSALESMRVRMTRSEIKLTEQDIDDLQKAPGQGALAGVTGASADALQKKFGENSPIARRTIRRKMQLSSAVCRITGPRGGRTTGIGTGFAIQGDLLFAGWGPDPVIVTNHHVVSSTGTMGGRRADVCKAEFMSDEDLPQEVSFAGVLWESNIEAHDITILKPAGKLPASVIPLNELVTAGLGPHARDETGIGRCYVIGYPDADELAFSLADNIMLDHDGPEECLIDKDADGRLVCRGARPDPTRVHYRTPTVGGNSGSPVFDADTITLLGVHHAGARDMRKLNDKPGIYAANEGIWIYSIREAIAQTMSDAQREGAGDAPRLWGPPGFSRAEPLPPKPQVDELVMPATVRAEALYVPGSTGSPVPGISAYAPELIYPPGRAEPADRRAAQLETVIGADNRTRILDTQMAPWRMICAIRARWGSRLMIGTGCLIGEDTVLTAGHVVYARQFQAYAQHIEVIPGLNIERQRGEQRPYGAATARAVFAHDTWRSSFSPKFDVAIIKLDKPLGQATGWFGLGSRGREELLETWAHVTGYPGEMKEERAPGALADTAPQIASQLWHHAAPVDAIDNGRMFYKTDTTAGQSGAPIYVLPEAGSYATPTVVGVHAYGARSTPGAIGLANSGVWIDPDMFARIRDWSSK